MLIALWPQTWSRQQRSNATLVAALVLMVLALSLLGKVLSFLPEPIGSNAQASLMAPAPPCGSRSSVAQSAWCWAP